MSKAMTPELRELFRTNPSEFFRQMGSLGGRKRNKAVTKDQLEKWGNEATKVTTPAQRKRWGKKGGKASAAARKEK